jgi:hypothetical protein
VKLYVLRVGAGGTGSVTLPSTPTPGFLDHYDLSGALSDTVTIPITTTGAQHRVLFSGASTSEGSLTRSADGHYVTFAGFDADPASTTGVAGTANGTGGTPRVVGRLDANGMLDTSTVLTTAFSGADVRSAVTSDGHTFWVAGNSVGTPATGGIYTVQLGGTGETQILTSPNNVRWLGIFGGQLYADSGSAVATYAPYAQIFAAGAGSGLPTTGPLNPDGLAGLPISGASPYGFELFDLDPTIPGVDTLYLAIDTSTVGIQKWKYNTTISKWELKATFSPPGISGTGTAGVRGLAATVSGTNVTLYVTTAEATGTTANRLMSVTDDGSAAPAFTLLATAAANTAFRGVAIAPQ